ncbi:hydrolase [Candidatus Dependentiae bacterium Noda2021]|nr:hydrolase [Candidatus Dependentiae bacterium Noda2021]
MKRLYTPWRSSYASNVQSFKDPHATSDQCVFCCQLRTANDEKNHILRRYKHSYLVMNKFPYNAGHLLILPLEHVQSLDQLSPEARAEIMELTSAAVNVLQNAINAQGVNVGINLGRAAGAGIPSHLHVHVLPRWQGDTNFLPAIAHVKTISFDLDEIYHKLKPFFDSFNLEEKNATNT